MNKDNPPSFKMVSIFNMVLISLHQESMVRSEEQPKMKRKPEGQLSIKRNRPKAME